MHIRLTASVAALAMLAGCGGGADPAQIVDTIRQTEEAQLASIESDDLRGIARLYDDNAKLVRPDGTVLDGGVAIVEAYDGLLKDPGFALTIEPLDGWASASDDLAVLTSRVQFSTTDPDSGEVVTQPLSSETVWKRETGGSWKIVSAYNVAITDGEAESAQTTE